LSPGERCEEIGTSVGGAIDPVSTPATFRGEVLLMAA
jgi:hypothetical protein